MRDIEHVLDYQIICKTSFLLVPQKEFQYLFKYGNSSGCKISSIWMEDPGLPELYYDCISLKCKSQGWLLARYSQVQVGRLFVHESQGSIL